jgi:hypothetical protein
MNPDAWATQCCSTSLKNAERSEIEKHVQEFLKAGGKIKREEIQQRSTEVSQAFSIHKKPGTGRPKKRV